MQPDHLTPPPPPDRTPPLLSPLLCQRGCSDSTQFSRRPCLKPQVTWAFACAVAWLPIAMLDAGGGLERVRAARTKGIPRAMVRSGGHTRPDVRGSGYPRTNGGLDFRAPNGMGVGKVVRRTRVSLWLSVCFEEASEGAVVVPCCIPRRAMANEGSFPFAQTGQCSTGGSGSRPGLAVAPGPLRNCINSCQRVPADVGGREQPRERERLFSPRSPSDRASSVFQIEEQGLPAFGHVSAPRDRHDEPVLVFGPLRLCAPHHRRRDWPCSRAPGCVHWGGVPKQPARQGRGSAQPDVTCIPACSSRSSLVN